MLSPWNNDFSFIFASRYLSGGGSEDDTLLTLFGNKFFTLFGKIFYNLKISDILYTYILGRTDLEVSEVGFGLWTVSDRSWGVEQPSDGVRLVQNAFDLGLNFFDTADFYGYGYGEEIIPEALGSHRHEIIVSTKFSSYILLNNIFENNSLFSE